MLHRFISLGAGVRHTGLRAALLLLLVCAALGAYAQGPGSGGPGSGGPSPGGPTQAPIDGGASLLLAAGAAYGVRRLAGRRR
ncbi:PID-CTERM protein-sorting domain-containing protein [Hymenobacter citatus]|uniref:PID-CTERM protein-sorting domain-containing protein n=1 Tax=Hymenobacter citatus TaxID=2763506 RepID=UPI003CCCDA2C